MKKNLSLKVYLSQLQDYRVILIGKGNALILSPSPIVHSFCSCLRYRMLGIYSPNLKQLIKSVSWDALIVQLTVLGVVAFCFCMTLQITS